MRVKNKAAQEMAGLLAKKRRKEMGKEGYSAFMKKLSEKGVEARKSKKVKK